MSLTRRELLAATGVAALPFPSSIWRPVSTWRAPLRILFIGGTGFIGPHMVRQALARGHQVTLFNRGRTNPGLFPQAEKLVGDRDGGLGVLKGRSWDAVIDTSGYIPRTVRDSAQLLAKNVRRYVFISTGDVYASFSKVGIDEDEPLDVLDDPKSEDASKYYGAFKAICERTVREFYPDGHTILRPGWIIGAGDYNDISSYWPMRIDRGGEVLAPGNPSDPTQIIDAHDLAGFVLKSIEEGITGTFNTVGPEGRLTWAEFLYGIRAVTSADVKFTWVDADWLAARKVMPWTDLPIWWPPRDDYQQAPMFEPGGKGFAQMDGRRAIKAGLTFRPLADTARDIITEYQARPAAPANRRVRFGLAAEREKELLAAWHQQVGR
ncbi:MAG: NAD-dependent epimerase/dehydratase family protein [Gemmatimonadales bacterium]|nr:NAD-dependent epimerase/dehydratase family protein [Gemmatimonadales bacterium]